MFNQDVIRVGIKEGRSLMEICDEYGYIYHRVYYWCKRNGLNVSKDNNGKSSRTKNARKKQLKVDTVEKIEQLQKLYIQENKSVHEIAKMFNTTGATVAASLRRAGIPVKLQNGQFIKKRPKYSKNVLTELYINKQLSAYEISDLLNYKNHGAVVEDLKFYNIERRTYKEAGKLLYEKHPEKRELHREQFYQGITGPKSNSISSLEMKFMVWAVSNDIEFKYQFQIRSNWHRYDFLLTNTNIIVEMDGDFWHSSPEHITRDNKFDETAKQHGYKVIRIRESELTNNPNILNEKILTELENINA